MRNHYWRGRKRKKSAVSVARWRLNGFSHHSKKKLGSLHFLSIRHAKGSGMSSVGLLSKFKHDLLGPGCRYLTTNYH